MTTIRTLRKSALPLACCLALALAASAHAFELKSSAFRHGSEIPQLYTCQGKDISPPLAWSGVPAGTRSLALICEDPDAPIGTWVHWVYYNIPVTLTALPEAMPKTERPAPGGIHGKSSFKDFGYGGPCPPWGTHRYYFRLYALDTSLTLEPGATKKDMLKAIQGHVLGTAELMGTYKKK
ncbi:MAG TPA: YbhB/YbcL family Raf kinase inhibitor-like protein [Deltaproteobacteria bacterium]|nr:YbhB/YbcL family Raf kinase inhibitor-like protein [Deltaproteobacteria bacterium]HQI80150.1 YbhB/YbcL family Raf kinase inhibitor-like protein [Deltaproteobacteria bacterium]